MAKGQDVAVIKTADLVALWGDEVVIRKSAREGARFPLYLSTIHGPVPVNSYAGQDALLEHGKFKGAETPEPEKPEPVNPEKPEPPAPEKPEPNPEPKQSAFSKLLNTKVL